MNTSLFLWNSCLYAYMTYELHIYGGYLSIYAHIFSGVKETFCQTESEPLSCEPPLLQVHELFWVWVVSVDRYCQLATRDLSLSEDEAKLDTAWGYSVSTPWFCFLPAQFEFNWIQLNLGWMQCHSIFSYEWNIIT